MASGQRSAGRGSRRLAGGGGGGVGGVIEAQQANIAVEHDLVESKFGVGAVGEKDGGEGELGEQVGDELLELVGGWPPVEEKVGEGGALVEGWGENGTEEDVEVVVFEDLGGAEEEIGEGGVVIGEVLGELAVGLGLEGAGEE